MRSATSPWPLQAKILRVLERGEIQPLGSEEPRQVDVRIVTATNRDLQERVAAGQFRQDLYWRINVITLELPPLRARRDDLPVLIRHFLDLAAEETGRGRLSLAPDVETRLVGYDYPGNLRELENILRRAAILATRITHRAAGPASERVRSPGSGLIAFRRPTWS